MTTTKKTKGRTETQRRRITEPSPRQIALGLVAYQAHEGYHFTLRPDVAETVWRDNPWMHDKWIAVAEAVRQEDERLRDKEREGVRQ